MCAANWVKSENSVVIGALLKKEALPVFWLIVERMKWVTRKSKFVSNMQILIFECRIIEEVKG